MSSPRNIFVIDDDGDFVALLTEILSQAGYQVQSNTHPSEALAIASQNHFDLIIIDQKMGQMTGVDLLSKLREKDPGTPVIIVSGFLEPSATQTFINLGVSGIFLKPLNIFALLQRVEELFKGLVRSSGSSVVESGIRGLTRTPFGGAFNKEFFLKKVQSLASFRGSLLLVGDTQSPFQTIAEAIVKKSVEGDKLVVWQKDWAESHALENILPHASLLTILINSIESLSTEERCAIYKIAKNEEPFDKIPPTRFIVRLERELEELYEKQIVDDEMYLFLGNLELRLPRGATSETLRQEDTGAVVLSSKTESPAKIVRIMVLDDEDLHAQMVVDLLQEAGYSTLKLNNPAEALSILRKERFSLVITDFRMPGINGVDFVTQARQLDSGLPIFIVSGNIQLPEMVRIGNMGITRLIQKPIDLKTFIDQVKQIHAR